jgi:hypothetical protein
MEAMMKCIKAEISNSKTGLGENIRCSIGAGKIVDINGNT